MAVPVERIGTVTDPRRHMSAELAHLTRRLAERCQVQVTGDEGERAVVHEAHEVLSTVRELDRARVHALTDALARMTAGTWGRCELCRDKIAPARLAALPETEWCRDCAASLERDAAMRPRKGASECY